MLKMEKGKTEQEKSGKETAHKLVFSFCGSIVTLKKLEVLWDFVENKPYPAQSTNAPYNNTTFSAVGPDGDRFYTGARIIVR